MKNLIYIFLVAAFSCFMISGVKAQDPAVTAKKSYTLGNSSFSLAFPEDWTEQMLTGRDGSLVISLAPQQGDDFRVMITPGNLDEVPPTFTIKDFAAGHLAQLAANAVEENPELQEFDCISGKGYYYMLTDKNHNPSNPQDFPLLIQAYSPAGKLILMTTVLCRDKDSPVIKEVLSALSRTEGHEASSVE